jgi:hypothetical protein
VRDGLVSRKGFWSLYVDNSLPDCVVVFLGDLGRLPHKEQLYWKSHNIQPKGGLSRTAFKRVILGEWADPDKPDLYLKMRLLSFNKKWNKKFGWDLFLPLSNEDSHYLDALHIPTSPDNAREFDEQLLAIVKVVIDSLNEKELAAGLESMTRDAKGIDKLEAFLVANGKRVPEMIEFLRNVQLLRSTTVAHRRSRVPEKNAKLRAYFKMEEKNLGQVFEDIVTHMIWTLNTLEHLLLKDGT